MRYMSKKRNGLIREELQHRRGKITRGEIFERG